MKGPVVKGAAGSAWATAGGVRAGGVRAGGVSRGLIARVLRYSGKSNCVFVWPPCPTNSSVKSDFHSGKGATDKLVFPGSRKE